MLLQLIYHLKWLLSSCEALALFSHFFFPDGHFFLFPDHRLMGSPTRRHSAHASDLPPYSSLSQQDCRGPDQECDLTDLRSISLHRGRSIARSAADAFPVSVIAITIERRREKRPFVLPLNTGTNSGQQFFFQNLVCSPHPAGDVLISTRASCFPV